MLQSNQIKHSGFKLFDKGNGIWAIQSSTRTFTGSFGQVHNFAVISLGFESKEIVLGRNEMEKHFHNAAEYGIFKGFMWSFDVEEKNARSLAN